ncbi:MAG: ABC transporter permease, partial [Aquiluna sp.]
MSEPLTQVNALASEQAPKNELSTGAKVLNWMADNGIFVLTALLIGVAVIGVEGFASLQNIADVFHRAAPIGIVAVGMTFVVISGNYLDLSVVAQVATAAVILIAVSNEYGYFLAIIAAMIAATVFGIVNGVAVGYFKA